MGKPKIGIYEGNIFLKRNQESYVLAINQYSIKLLRTYAKFGGYIHYFRKQPHSFYQILKEVHGTKRTRSTGIHENKTKTNGLVRNHSKKKKGYFESLILKINDKF